MPRWWDERRYGLFVHASIASVPAWAPIGENADRYWSHLGGTSTAHAGSSQPMVEVLAHHRDRWGHIEQYDDFMELLTFDDFDAEAWARLAIDAGMGFGIIVAKHHDGLCWWDAPGTDRTVIGRGPKRNVLAEFAAACERNDLVFGTCLSRFDWSVDGSGERDTVLDQQAIDLVERYGSSLVCGDGIGEGAGVGDAGRCSPDVEEQMRAHNADLVFDSDWSAALDDDAVPDADSVRTFEITPPDEITPGPWQLRRGVGQSGGNNRNERDEHHMSGFDIVALLTEVIAKGGHLVLGVGPTADGSVPEMQAGPLRDAGTWIRTHQRLINRSATWTTWGDDDVRYITVDGVVHAIDITGTGVFAAIESTSWRATAVDRLGAAGEETMHFVHGDDGLRLDLPRSTPWRRSALPLRGDVTVDIGVYRIELEAVDEPIALFDQVEPAPIDLAPLLRGVAPGEIVELGDGTYRGPATVPAGVILRGLGPSRTRVESDDGPALTLERTSRVEHMTIARRTNTTNTTNMTDIAIHIDGQFATVLGCRIDGHLGVRADDVLVRATTLNGVHADGCNRLTISRCQLEGNRDVVGINFDGGADHEVDSCEISGHHYAIRATATTGMVARGNTIEARLCGVHLEGTERTHVHGNQIRHTMRAIDVDAGTSALIEGNAVTNGDSGCIVQRGAADCRVSGNHWERCRVGLLAWDANDLHQQDNHVFALHDQDASIITGP